MTGTRKIHVLIVDDDPLTRLMASEALRESGYSSVEAEDGLRALALFDTERPDLVLMDLKMPVMDGYEATRLIRAEAPTAPLVVMSAFAYEGDIERAYEAGCTDYVTKPVDGKELLAKIEALG